MVCWGLNDQGQTDAPEGVYQSVTPGYDHTCALRESGEAVCWGSIHPSIRVPPDLGSLWQRD